MTTAQPGMGLVIGMGLGTVFVGLICIIAICYIMGAVIRAFESRKPAAAAPEPKSAPEESAGAKEEIADKGELIAAVSAAIAEELGDSVEAFRIVSIKKL